MQAPSPPARCHPDLWQGGAGTPALAVPQVQASPFGGVTCCGASSALSPLWGRGGLALSAPDSWPPAPIWRSPAGVPGRAPYLHVRVHACAVSLLCDNKSLVTTCPGSQIVSPVPVPLLPRPWAGGFALPAAGAWPAVVVWAARVLRDPARAGCSCWHRGSWSQIMVPVWRLGSLCHHHVPTASSSHPQGCSVWAWGLIPFLHRSIHVTIVTPRSRALWGHH